MDVFNRGYGIEVPKDVRAEDAKTTRTKTYAYAREMVSVLRGFGSGQGAEYGGEKVSGKVKAPTLVVAATAHDPVGYTGLLAAELREQGSEESRAVKLVEMPHGWGQVDPELFARGVEAWVEGRALPKRFEDI